MVGKGEITFIECYLFFINFQVDYPVYWTLKEICDGFQKLLDHLQLDKASIWYQIKASHYLVGHKDTELDPSWPS